jgi:hypothetical protein
LPQTIGLATAASLRFPNKIVTRANVEGMIAAAQSAGMYPFPGRTETTPMENGSLQFDFLRT